MRIRRRIGRRGTRGLRYELLAPILVLSVCGRDVPPRVDRTEAAPPPHLPEDLFEQVGTISLEEDSSVVNVSPNVTAASDGSFLIADARETRVRIYDHDGRLITQFGSRGDGPGDMHIPISVWRLGGTLRVADFTGLIHDFDSTGGRFLQRVRSPVAPLYKARPLDAQRLLLTGMRRGSEEPRPLIHIWDHDSKAITHSFFPTPGDSLTRLVSRNFGGAAVAIRGDTVAAVASFTDTLFLFSPEGAEIDRIPLPFVVFKRMETYNPRLSHEQLQAWLSQLTLITDLFWLDDGSFLVQRHGTPEPANDFETLSGLV